MANKEEQESKSQEQVTLPNVLPNIQMNELEYEQGFDEKSLVNPEYADIFICAICRGIPRQPVCMKDCGHMFCETCIQQQVTTEASYNGKLRCALCKRESRVVETVPFKEFCPSLKKVFRLAKLRCPLGCEFIGDPQEMDEHETFRCERRVVCCPSAGCPVKASYKEMTEHIQSCPNLMINCRRCRLPVKRARLESHDCLKRMALALMGMCFV